MQVRRSVFRLGVYKPEWGDEWPWAFESENGQYLSAKYRICSELSAAKFSDVDEARSFFHGRKRRDEYKLEIVESKEYVTVPDPTYPENHPRSILKRINQNEISSIRTTALFWFLGDDLSELWSAATLKKHRTALLKYNIDIDHPPSQKLEPEENHHDDVWHLARPSLAQIES